MHARTLLLGVVASFAVSAPATAAFTTNFFQIFNFNTGWATRDIVITPVGSVLNQDGCSNPDAYASLATTSGHRERTVALLSAFLDGREVALRLQGCDTEGRPIIIGVAVR